MPTAEQIEDITDALAARIQLNLNGYTAELGAAANDSVATILDAVGDADLEAALLSYALAVDRQSLPANQVAALAQILARPGYSNLVQQWEAFTISEAGGYASFDALLTDVGAQLHPLAAELFRSPNNESRVSAANCFCPNYGIVAPVRVYTGADGSLVDDTVDAGDTGTADVALFENDDECLYLGSDGKFSAFVLGLSTLASVSVAPTFQYWNGSAWVTLSTATDNSAGFIKNDLVTFTPPANWQRCAADAGGTDFADRTPRYYVRVSRTANTVVTPPVATCISLVPSAVLNTSGGHLGVPQPPLALLRITGAGTIVVVAGVVPDFARFNAPAIRFRALSEIGTSPVLTASYLDQNGDAATQLQSAWATPAALATVDVTLAGGDTGVQGISTTGWTVSSGAQGVIAVEVVETRTPAL